MLPNNLSPDAFLARLVEWASERAEIRSMLLTSTRAVPGAAVDALSDYDVILIVQDIQPFVSDRAWLNDFGTVLIAYWDPVHADPDFDIEVGGNVIQYIDGLKIDFTLWSVSLFEKIVASPDLPAELDAGYLVLLDKDQLTANLRPASGRAYIPMPPTFALYRTQINDFLSDAPYVAKCLWRNDLLPAKWCLDHDMKQIYLRQMLEWRIEIDHGWSVPVGHLGKGLKKWLRPDLWAQLELTYAGANIDDNWAALAATLALYRQVALEIAAYFGYIFPETLYQRVCVYVKQIEALEVNE